MTGAFKAVWKYELPFIPGYDLSGVIDAVGEGVNDFKVGDEAFCINWGKVRHDDDEGNTVASAFAEYIDLPASKLSHKPASVSHETAAAVAMVGQTALQVLNAVKVGAGQKVLVLGGSGAVGTQLIQQAKLRGAHVIATASTRAVTFVTELGADRVINYNEESWWLEPRPDYDAVIDAVGESQAFEHAQIDGVVKYGGSFLTVATFAVGFDPAAHAPRFAFAAFFGGFQEAAHQDEVIQLVAEGKLRVPIEDVFPSPRRACARSSRKLRAASP